MPALLTRETRIQNAKNFVRSILSTTNDRDILYAFIGRAADWGLGTDSNGAEVVPTPVDKLNANELTTRYNIIGIKKIGDSDVSHVVPRIDWTSGATYVAYSNNNENFLDTNFYVLTDDLNVYKCTTAGGGTSTVKPTGTSTSIINLGDGYSWKFLYTVTTPYALNFLTTDWLPVPYPAPVSSAQEDVEAAASYSAGQPLGGHGSSAVHELGGFYLMINAKFQNSEGGVLPTSDDFRQVGLIINPLLDDTNGTAATANAYAVADIDTLSGRILYVENRTPIVRAPTQTETSKIIIEF